MNRRTRINAFTLVELLATLALVGALAGSATPLVLRLADAHHAAVSQRDQAESVGAAMERIARFVREIPRVAAESDEVAIASASASRFELSSGDSLELTGQTLWLVEDGAAASPLLQGTTVFELAFIGGDGTTDTSGDLGQTQRVDVRIATGDFELRSSAFIRVARGDE